MDEKHPKRRRRRSFGFWAAVALTAGGVLYPLSAGPATWFETRGLYPEWAADTIGMAYYPLDLACEHSPAFRMVAIAYLQPWIAQREQIDSQRPATVQGDNAFVNPPAT